MITYSWSSWSAPLKAEEAPSQDVLEQAQVWLRGEHAVAIATVTRTWGSSPCPLGSQLVVRGDGRFAGSVSGGCIEGAVIQAAFEVIASEMPKILEFGVTNDQAWESGLACGGKIEVFVEKIA